MTTSIWRDRRFSLYATGIFINSIGNSIYDVALPLMVYSLTHSVVDMSVMKICETVPRSLLGLMVVGPLVDRVSRRTVLRVTLVFQAICSTGIALLNARGTLQIWMLYVLGALIMAAHEFYRSADFAVVPAMFGERKMEANSGLQASFRLSLILGPLLGGLLLAYTSYDTLLWINALTYFGPLVMQFWTRVPHEKLGGVHSFAQMRFDLREGIVYLTQQTVLVRIVCAMALLNLAIGGLNTVMVFDLKSKYAWTDQTISWLMALSAVGSLVSSLMAPRLKHVARGKLMFWSLLLTSVSMALLMVPRFWMYPIALIVSGLGSVLFYVAYSVTTQELISNEMMGRAGSAVRMIEFFSRGISNWLLAAEANWIGAIGTYGSVFVISLLPVLLMGKYAGRRSSTVEQAIHAGVEL